MKIGFIGQGFIGKNMANDFESRGYEVVRYSLEPEYIGNKEKLKECEIVFIGVPTPTTPNGFDASILRDAIRAASLGQTVVIKSTIVPGTTESIQKENPELFVMHSPEFLREATAAEDAKHPERNIIGIPIDSQEYRRRAEQVISVLPKAPYYAVVLSKESELIKYIGNIFLFNKVVFMNMMYDLAEKMGADWDKISEAVSMDSRIGKSHMNPVNQSGRGAGGHCFIKDFEALKRFYEATLADPEGSKVLEALREENSKLLRESGKDLDLLRGVYGD